MLWPKKIHTRNLITKKKFLRPGAHKLVVGSNMFPKLSNATKMLKTINCKQ